MLIPSVPTSGRWAAKGRWVPKVSMDYLFTFAARDTEIVGVDALPTHAFELG